MATELVDDVFNSKQAMHGRVADLRCLWATCMQGAEDSKAILFSLIVEREVHDGDTLPVGVGIGRTIV